MHTAKHICQELFVFTHKQAYSCLFGGLLLGFIIVTYLVELPGLYRYDYIFLFAILVQLLLVLLKFETLKEVWVILMFHLVATGMELFKTHDSIGSWQYPEPAVFAILSVPLFTGFLYSAVGSYLARSWRILELRFTNYPRLWHTYLLAALIYINFFTHHFVIDIRPVLFVVTAVLFYRTTVYFRLTSTEHRMPLLLGFGLITFFIWIGENIGSFTGTWLYPSQLSAWELVSLGKFGSWFLLMIVSFVLVSWVHRRELRPIVAQVRQ